jgi:hypothetical protein
MPLVTDRSEFAQAEVMPAVLGATALAGAVVIAGVDAIELDIEPELDIEGDGGVLEELPNRLQPVATGATTASVARILISFMRRPPV